MAEDPASERPDDAAGDESAPLGELADRIRARRSDERDGTEADRGIDAAELFQAESVEAIDSAEFWDAVDEPVDPSSAVEAAEDPNEHIVPKRSYCEDCEYFSEPPDVECSHAGTSILEYVDLDHLRVRNCPIVEQRRSVGERDAGPLTQMTFGRQGTSK